MLEKSNNAYFGILGRRRLEIKKFETIIYEGEILSFRTLK